MLCKNLLKLLNNVCKVKVGMRRQNRHQTKKKKRLNCLRAGVATGREEASLFFPLPSNFKPFNVLLEILKLHN